jgi:PAS domain S-box-containing protein
MSDMTAARQVISSIDQPAWVLDSRGEILTINRAALSTLGYHNDDDVLGTCSHTLFHHSHVDGGHYERSTCPVVNDTRVRSRGNEWFIRRSGVPLPVSWSRSPIHLDSRELTVITLQVLVHTPDTTGKCPDPLRQRASDLGRRALYKQACELIAARGEDPTLGPAAIARSLHVSLRYLQTAFSQANDSPAQHIRVARLTRAVNLINAGSSVSEAIDHAGFADQSTFRRAYRRHFGTTPTEQRTAW